VRLGVRHSGSSGFARQDRRTARERERARAKRTKRREWFQFDVMRTVFYLTLRFRRCQIPVTFTLICFGNDLLRTFTKKVDTRIGTKNRTCHFVQIFLISWCQCYDPIKRGSAFVVSFLRIYLCLTTSPGKSLQTSPWGRNGAACFHAVEQLGKGFVGVALLKK